MADYWKSQPRKFCQYCKCWIADNKPSIEFHERGKNHKENVAAKISEIKKKSMEKVKQEERMSKQFAAMEEAALKAYQEDLKRIEMESGSQAQTTAPAHPPTQARPPSHAHPQVQQGQKVQQGPQVQPGTQVQPKVKRKQKKEQRPSKIHRGPAEAQSWVEGTTDDGHTYYYNSITGESKWEKPWGFQGGSSNSVPLGRNESPSGNAWMEAVSPDGYTYYYNSETGESSWERPVDFPSPPNEAAQSGSACSKEGESQEEASEPQPNAAGEESTNEAPASQQAEDGGQASQPSTVSKISFGKRKGEAEPSENEGEDKASCDTPKEDAQEKTKEEDTQSQSLKSEPEKKVVKVIQAKRPKTANPYGAWEEIQEEEDPYAKVDLQLPQIDEGFASGPAELPPEPKPKFRERIITSLGDESGPASFRKSKMHNGKSRSIRRRDNDD